MKNKKLVIIIAAVVVVLAVVLAVVLLGGNKTPAGPTEKEYKLGMGAVAGTHNASQTNLTVATVVVDADGKIVACRLDVAQNKYKFDADKGEVVFTVLDSKKELKEDYKMKPVSGIGKEWYEQAEAFEKFVVGKTAKEVEALTVVQNGTHWVSNDPVLSAGCTMDIVDFKAAVVKACNDDQGMSFKTDKEFKLGLGVNSANDKSSATDDKNYTVKLNVEFAASVVIDGKVVATLNDAYQPNVVVVNGEVTKATVGTFNKEGADDKGFMTKRELKELYNMIPASPIKTEWYVQSANYSNFVLGKTGAEIAGLELSDDLKAAGCTIYIGGINAVVAESVTNAR